MTPTTLTLDPNHKQPADWLGRMIRNATPGTKIEYWHGLTDVNTSGKRKHVFEYMLSEYEKGKVHLVQNKVDGFYSYVGVVR